MNQFLAGNQMLLAHGPQVLRLPDEPGETEGTDYIVNCNAGLIRQVIKIPLGMWYALQLRVKTLHFSGSLSGSWSASSDVSLPGSPPDPGQSIAGDIEYDIPFYRTGPLTRGLPFTGAQPFGFDDCEAVAEQDILGPNRDWDAFETNPEFFDEVGLLPWRGLQNNGFAEKIEDPAVTSVVGIPDGVGSIFTGVVFARLRLGGTRPGAVVVGPSAGDFFDKAANEVYMPIEFLFEVAIPSLFRGFEFVAIPAGVPGAPPAALGLAGSITLKISGFPDFEIPIIWSSWIIRFPFHLLFGISKSLSVSGTLEATEFWEYQNSEGLPVYEGDTGVQLRDPLL